MHKLIRLVITTAVLSVGFQAAAQPPELRLQNIVTPGRQALFDLQVDGQVVAYGVANFQTVGPYVVQNPGSHTVTAVAAAGTDPAAYDVAFGGDCQDDHHGHGTVALAQNDMKTCIVTHLGPPSLVASVDALPQIAPNDPTPDRGLFDVFLDNRKIATDLDPQRSRNSGQDTRVSSSPGPGLHTLSEREGTGTHLSNYVVVLGGDCGPDGSVRLARGDGKTCWWLNVAPEFFIGFEVTTGKDDLRGDSTATVGLLAPNGRDVIQTFTLKSKGEAAWTNDSGPKRKTFQLVTPIQPIDFSGIVVTLTQGGSWPEHTDDWDVTGLTVTLGSKGPAQGQVPGEFCLLGSRSFRLTGPAPSVTLLPGFDPETACHGAITDRVPPVSFSPAPGTYQCPQTVSLSYKDLAGNSAAAILFTTDGSRPSSRSSKYVGPITVTSSESIVAIAVNEIGRPSPMTRHSYVCRQEICPTGQHCCGDWVNGKCSTGCTGKPCDPPCPAGMKECNCGGARCAKICPPRCP